MVLVNSLLKINWFCVIWDDIFGMPKLNSNRVLSMCCMFLAAVKLRVKRLILKHKFIKVHQVNLLCAKTTGINLKWSVTSCKLSVPHNWESQKSTQLQQGRKQGSYYFMVKLDILICFIKKCALKIARQSKKLIVKSVGFLLLC